MKGSNYMHLNKATMIEIVQEWLDKRYQGMPPEVTDVTSKRDMTETFEIKLESPVDGSDALSSEPAQKQVV